MKRVFAFLLGVLVLVLFSSAWAQCPEDPLDLGHCDTLHVEAWPYADTCFIGCSDLFGCDTVCINEDGKKFPCFLYVNLFVTHDSNTFYFETEEKWVQDSISSFVVPLVFWHPEGGSVDSVVFPIYDTWNSLVASPYNPNIKRSVFRDMIDRVAPDTFFNRMLELGSLNQGAEWSNMILSGDSLASQGDSGATWMSLIPIGPTNRRWWEGKRVLLTTLTYMVYMSQDAEDTDTAEVCFDTTLWPPSSRLEFGRPDAAIYIARHNLPVCFWVHDGIAEVATATDVRWIEGSAEEENRPTSFSVSQNYPNPFNPATEFKFDLPRACHVEIEVFNILGQRVKTLVDERRAVGSHVVDWDGKDARGVDVSSGIYFYRMIADDFSDIKKMVLLK